ncbi:MAG: insulinase family protein [Psychrosphaera sp.]|nr:insulinase family protein [Psychrosphaera sp.]
MIISPNDCKQYQSFTLDNGLRVIVIHDVNSEKSAASLTVNCGHFDDPSERQGMAHFVEHMVFLGTETDPDPGSYHQFISGHGGSNNAWTGTEFTSYFFDINNEFIDEALTRFSHFFSEPLLAEEYIEKERNAIEAEYKLKLKEDSHRIYQVHKATINPAHPFSKFSGGNVDTLADRDGISIRQELVDFHDTYYVPHHMSLVVIGTQSLDEQEALVRKLFSKLSDHPGKEREVQVPMYLEEHKDIEIFIEPHKHSQKLIASFSMPCTDKYYKNKTINYIAHLIGYEGEGSILSLLKQKGWCNNLSAGRGIAGSNFKDFNVSFDLTNKGLQHSDEIITVLFEYIALLKQNGNNDMLFSDKKKLLQLAFDYQEKTKPINQVSHLSVNMFHYAQDHYIYGDYIMDHFNQSEFDEICQYLRATNLRIVHIHPDVETNREAQWYHTPYSFKKIDSQRIEHWGSASSDNSALSMPGENPYLKNEVKIEPLVEGEVSDIPQIISKDEGYTFWFKQDEMFNVPKGHAYIAIDCPISTANIENIAITRLFTELFLDEVLEAHYSAELAGLSYHVYVHQGGLTIHTSGISTNQPLLIEKLLESLKTLSFSQERFEELKNQLYTHWLNSAKSKPVSQLFSTLTSTLQPNNPTMEQMAQGLKDVSFEQFLAVREQLFTQVHVDAFAYGNWTKAQALELTARVKEIIFTKAEPHAETVRPILSLQGHHNLAIEKPLQHYDNAIVMYYQANSKAPKITALFILLNHVIGPEFFNEMRTEKQLGYLVGTGYVPLNRFPGIALYIQSPNNESSALYHEISCFLRNFVQELLEISPQQWQKTQQGLITQVIEKDSNLRMRSQRFWFSIGNKDPLFSERDLVAEQIMLLTPNDLFKFAKMTLLQYSDAKLTVMTSSEIPIEAPIKVIEVEQLADKLLPLNS